MLNFKKLFEDIRDQDPGLVGYALIMILVLIVVLGVLILLGPQFGQVYSTVKADIS